MSSVPFRSCPDWFNAGQYDYLRGLGVFGWTQVVQRLLDARWRLCDPSAANLQGARPADPDTFLAQLLADPMEPAAERPGYFDKFDADHYQFGSVAAVTAREVADMASALEAIPLGRFLRSYLRARDLNASQKRLRERALRFGEAPFLVILSKWLRRQHRLDALSPRRVVSIDLSAPDEIVLADFADWLTHARTLDIHRAAPKVYTEADFHRWCEQAFAPYWILKLWASSNARVITHNEMARLLFPASSLMGGDNVRRTIRPRAEHWLSVETLRGLEAQAARRIGAE